MTTSAFAAGAYGAAQGLARPGIPKPAQGIAQGPTAPGGFTGFLQQSLDSVAQSGAQADRPADSPRFESDAIPGLIPGRFRYGRTGGGAAEGSAGCKSEATAQPETLRSRGGCAR